MNVARITFSHRFDKLKSGRMEWKGRTRTKTPPGTDDGEEVVEELEFRAAREKPPVIYDQLVSYLPPQSLCTGKGFTGRGHDNTTTT